MLASDATHEGAIMRFSLIGGLIAALALGGAATAQSVIVRGPQDRVETVSAADIKAMHRASVTIPYGDKATFTGAVIGDLLAEVGAPSDLRLHGPPVNQI